LYPLVIRCIVAGVMGKINAKVASFHIVSPTLLWDGLTFSRRLHFTHWKNEIIYPQSARNDYRKCRSLVIK
jgi:hypothetical protein